MPNTPDPRLTRRRPTEQELDAEATVTADDILEAVTAFNRHAPPDARGLLNAVEDKK